MLLVSSSSLCPRAVPQVQERCDYDLVTPLALLFYSAVLYVSAEAAAPTPARGRHQNRAGFGWNTPACFHQLIPKRKILYESIGIDIK